MTDLPDSPRIYAVMLSSEHKQGLHEESPHTMCRACNPAEAELLDRINDQS